MTRLVWHLFLLLLVSVPLALGGYRPLAWSLDGLGIALLLLGWLGLVLTDRIPIFWPASLWPPLLLFLGLLLWIAFQLAWPSPAGFEHPLWQLAGEMLGQPLAARISAAPESGLVALIRLLSGAGIFWLAVQFGRDPARAWQMLHWIGWGAGLAALYGLGNYFAGNDYLLWYRRWAYLPDVTGTFVNRNSYATYAGIGALVLAALAIRALRRNAREVDPGLSRLGRRVQAVSGQPLLYLVLALASAMALLQSHSRMGFVAGVSGALVMLVLLIATRALRGWLPMALVAGSAGLLYLVSAGGTLDRIARTSDDVRSQIFASTERAIQSAPLTGSGFGSFASVFPMYRDLSLAMPYNVEMAHNSYLELAMDLGIPAALVLLTAIAWLGVATLAGVFRRSRDQLVPIVATSALVLVAVHSTMDFSMQIPGVGYTLFALLGLGVAQAWPMREATAAPASSQGRSDLAVALQPS